MGVVASQSVVAERPQSLRVQVVWMLAGNLSYAGAQWLMLVILARFAGIAAVGRYSLGLAICAPLVMFSNLQLRNIQATDATGQFGAGHYFALRLSTSALAFLAVVAVGLIGVEDAETRAVVFFVGAAKVVEAVSDVLMGYLQRHERMNLVSTSMMAKAVASVVGLSVGSWFTASATGGVTGLLVAWAAVLLVFDLPRVRTLARHREELVVPQWAPQVLLPLTRLALPLGVVILLTSLIANIPRYFVHGYWGPGELGIYAAVVSLVLAGNTVVSAMAQAASPRLSQLVTRDRRGFWQLLGQLSAAGALLGLAGVACAWFGCEYLLRLFKIDSSQVSRNVLAVLMLGGTASYVAAVVGTGMTAARVLKPQVPIILGIAVLCVLLSLLLIPSRGLAGAAETFLATSAVQGVAVFFVLMRVLR